MNDVIKIINKYKSFALFCHISPDADALGSMNALRMTLKKMGKKVVAYCDGKIPNNIAFLKIPLEENTSKILKSDVCIMLDCNSLDRLGKYGEIFDQAKIKVNIDHHQSMNYKFDYAFTDDTSPSTADLVYELIKNLDVTINSDIAENLYAGLSSDTGCFVHPSTNQTSHKHAYELINYKFDLQEANYNMFKYKQKNYLYFYKSVLRNTKPFLREKVYITFFNYKTYKRFEKICDNSASFQFLDGIDGNEIRVKIFEKERNFFTISFRSNKYANVCEIAKNFDGGGHIRASGGKYNGIYKDLLYKILQACNEELSKYNKDGQPLKPQKEESNQWLA